MQHFTYHLCYSSTFACNYDSGSAKLGAGLSIQSEENIAEEP